MARVKRAVNGKKHRRAVLEQAAGLLRQPQPHLPLRQRGGHALAAVRLPRPPGPQGRLPAAVDPADQRRRPGQRHQLQPARSPACARPRSWSTARCWPTWRSPTPTPSPSWSAVATAALGAGAAGAAWRRRRRTRPDARPRLPPPAGPAAAPAAAAAQRPAVRGRLRGRGGEAPRRRPRRRGRGRSRSSSATDAPADVVSRGRRRRPWPRPGRPGLRARPRGARAGGRHGHAPAGPGRGAHPEADPRGPRRRHLRGRLRRRPRPGQRRGGHPERPTRRAPTAWCAATGTVDPFNPKTVRASAGSVLHLPVVVGGEPAEVLEALGRPRAAPAGGRARTAGPRTPTSTWSPRWPSCSATRRPACPAALDDRHRRPVTIPMVGRAESLNVSMAAAVLCFEVARGHVLVCSPWTRPDDAPDPDDRGS